MEIKINNVYTNIVMEAGERAEVLYIDYSIGYDRETYELYFWTDGNIDLFSDFDTPKRTILRELLLLIIQKASSGESHLCKKYTQKCLKGEKS